MRLKSVTVSLCLLGLATTGTALAATNNTRNLQIKSLQTQLNQLQTKVNAMNSAPVSFKGLSNVMSLNSNFTGQMISNYTGTNTEMNLLQARQNGSVANQSLTVGGLVQADVIYQHTNTIASGIGQFSNPAVSDVHGVYNNNPQHSINQLALSNVNLLITAALNNWSTGFIQLGSYNIGRASGGAFGIQKAYLVLGNLAQSPVYGFAGRKDIDFGSFTTINPYSSPLTRAYFMATGNTAGVGYSQNGFNGTVSVMNGGQQGYVIGLSSLTQTQNLYTANANSINNYALNASYGQLTNGVNWKVGAGYLNGSAFTKASGSPASTNAAWDVNGKVSVSNFDLLAEYDATINEAPSGNGGISSLYNTGVVRALDLGVDYNFAVQGYKSVAGLDYSTISQGQSFSSNGVSYGNAAYQWVASYRVQPFKENNLWVGLEYANTRGILDGLAIGSRVRNNTLLLDVTAMF